MRRTIISCALGSAMAGTMSIAAHAQHVVTEDEAAKLTLEALTAAPRPVYRPVYRPIYRAFYHPAAYTRYGRTHGWQHAVTRVSYRLEASHHGRVRRRR